MLGKHKAASPVFLFMYNKNVRSATEDSLAHPKFWDNYPYYILISTGEYIHLSRYLDCDTTLKKYQDLKEYLKESNDIFYRFHYIKGNDTVYQQTLSSITKIDSNIIILTDKSSLSLLPNYLDTLKWSDKIFLIKNHLPIYLEKPNLSYFFEISDKTKVENLFVPRKEISEITDKYLMYSLSHLK
ncbi:hypothetical protein A9P82_08775 [Arachidicoccus ginsenosidimutans]|nr:hypothetical protein A9P82_08775 [Arachidicoccus sp. BS20]